MLAEYGWQDASCSGPHLGPLIALFSAPVSSGHQSGGEAGHDSAGLSCLKCFKPAPTMAEVVQAATPVVKAGSTKDVDHAGDGLSRRRRGIMGRLIPSSRSGGQLGSLRSRALDIAAAVGW